MGGIKEKLLGAHRAGCKIVLLPENNRNDTLDVPPEVTRDLEIRYMTKVDDVLDIVLGPAPERTSAPTPAMPPPAAGGGRVPAESLPS